MTTIKTKIEMTRFDKKTLKVGDKVYVSGKMNFQHKEIVGRWETVSRIGRQFFYTEETGDGKSWDKIHYDFDGRMLGTWSDSGQVFGPEAYHDEEEYNVEMDRRKRIDSLRNIFYRSFPYNELTIEGVGELEAIVAKYCDNSAITRG